MEAPIQRPLPGTLSRRTALQAGTLGLLGLGMPQLAQLRARDAERGRGGKPKSVIYIFLSGGLSQIDSFDMKPDAPQEIRGEFKPIATRTPGLQICEHLPRLARCSNLWSICRSVTHPWNEHSQGHHIMLTGRTDIPAGFDSRTPKDSDHPSITSMAQLLLEPRGILPPSMMLPDKIVHRTGRVLPGQFAGVLGQQQEAFLLELSKYNPNSYGAYPDYLFHHARGKEDGSKHQMLAPNFSLPQDIDLSRLQHRVELLSHLDKQQAHMESVGVTQGLDRYQEMAFSLLSDPKTKEAFDVHAAAPKVQERYGMNLFGRSLLLARQLVEAGVGLVQVNLGNNETWDTHQGAFPSLKNYLFPPMDRAVSALLEDLQARGLLDDTMVVMASEFGRTPRIFKIPKATLPGRDHWGAVQTVLFAGGGVQGGRVVGSSDAFGGEPASDPQKPEDFAATIYKGLGVSDQATWTDASGRPHFVYRGQPIEGLFG